MPPAQDEPPSESKLKQVAEAVADPFVEAVIYQAIEVAVDGVAKVVSGAVEVISGAGQVAADCGSAAVDAACHAAGSILDGV